MEKEELVKRVFYVYLMSAIPTRKMKPLKMSVADCDAVVLSKGLGGKLGKAVESDLGIKTIGDLLPYSESKLQDLYGTNTGWVHARIYLNSEDVSHFHLIN